MLKAVQFYCDNLECKDYQNSIDGYNDEKHNCKTCKKEMKMSTMMNRSVKGVRDFRWVD